ncbi:MBOAT family protein [Chroococcidiopsis sp. CCMEE 29]|uniref:MBOAT family O-acyltransferase n=1 Tax=Chroococcidiopsis sp. CCMEE 29 TaxID=155894 RepID=UPI002020352D|nr:MBOAT family protein [Chroococcidiopsis sp. CCMEE 29]
MLFNSYEFIFLFLPITLLVFFKLGGRGYDRVALGWLVIASLFFYGWWNPSYLALIIISMLFNYGVGFILGQHFTLPPSSRKGLLIAGLAVNLSLIGYFKYANFLVSSIPVPPVTALLNSYFRLDNIVLPLAISFFTFQQIAYLVDAYHGRAKELNFLKYCLFVSFFPQLIAGPIVHHTEIIPQFNKRLTYRFSREDFAVGLTIFSMGLFKKVVFADSIAVYATPVFANAAQGMPLTFFEAWGGALAYTLQLYFDFSGYSDMAIGAARMFGIKLPINFDSPYKAVSIIDFWRRWHITLSDFLRDYLYIPLGGNRKGQFRRYLNLLITMLLGGLWHGAGWTFVIWGGLHGIYLIINHQWHAFWRSLGHDLSKSGWWSQLIGRTVTFLAVLVAWVIFRAESLDAAIAVLAGMVGANGVVIAASLQPFLQPIAPFLTSFGVQFLSEATLGRSEVLMLLMLMTLTLIVWFAPNTQEWMSQYEPVLDHRKPKAPSNWYSLFWRKLQWQPNRLWGIAISCIIVTCILNLSKVSEFLYFNF